MLKSYVGIVTLNGLEVLLPEHEHNVCFLVRRARRQASRRAVCCWAVLPEDAAQEVRRQLECGEPYAALLTLDRAATDLGPILPAAGPDPDDVKPSARDCAFS